MLSSPHLLSPGMHWSMKPNNWGRKLCLKEKTMICLGKLQYLQKSLKGRENPDLIWDNLDLSRETTVSQKRWNSQIIKTLVENIYNFLNGRKEPWSSSLWWSWSGGFMEGRLSIHGFNFENMFLYLNKYILYLNQYIL